MLTTALAAKPKSGALEGQVHAVQLISHTFPFFALRNSCALTSSLPLTPIQWLFGNIGAEMSIAVPLEIMPVAVMLHGVHARLNCMTTVRIAAPC